MRKNIFITLALSILLMVLSGCTKSGKNTFYSKSTTNHIEFITPQVVGRLTPISISFMEAPKCPIGEAIEIYPKLRGIWDYSDNKATFTPDQPYKGNSKLTLKANIKKLFADESADDFEQNFYVESPSYSVDFDEVQLNAVNALYTVSGSVTTDIPVEENQINKLLSAKLGFKSQEIFWEKSDKDDTWKFSVNLPNDSDKNRNLEFKWSGKALGMDRDQEKLFDGSKQITIPGTSDFSIVDINTSKQNTILVSFSKPLDSSQDIESYIIAKNQDGKLTSNYTSSIHGNTLSIFSDSNFSDIQTVSFEQGIKSSEGIYLAKADTVTLSDKWEIPSVRFMNSNTILPTSQGAVFPIETKNLTGVIVQVYQIYERNMNQFLQDNELNETNKIYRVGEPIWEKKLSFNWDNSMQNKYIARGLDLSQLVKKYPEGMFHIRVSFRRDQIKYVCPYNHDYSSLPMPPDTIEQYTLPNEKSSWDYWENVSNRDRNDYWYNRNDPCHPAFYIASYNSSNTISRNILVSDIGLMAKKDNTGSLYIMASDMKTAKPLSNVEIEVSNYVGTPIAKAKTDSTGQVVIKTQKTAFVITAKNNNQTSYLKISEGSNLSTSHFEIGGEKVTDGLKGFIYGERGVWRPGDAMFLTFVLQDLEKSLPKNIPVTFELMDPLGHVTQSQLLTKSENNFYPITAKTSTDSPTGLWTGRVTIGGNTWTKYLSVESIVPNRLSVELEAQGEYLTSSRNNFTLSGAWLHGAEVPNYEADVSVAFSADETNFDGYSEYTFTNFNTNINYSRSQIWSGKLGADSKANFSTSLNAGQNLPGKLKAHFVSRIYEPSGNFSTQSKTIDFSPYDRYVGLKLPKGDAARNMLLTDTDHTVDVVLVDSNGKAIQGNSSLNYAFYKLDWKWWWEKDAYSSATHVSSRYYNKLDSGSFDVKNGKGSFKINVKYPDWGRYLVEVRDGSKGHTAAKVVYIDWPGWAGRAQDGGTGSAATLPLTADKNNYTAGETAQISFNGSANASAYIYIEKAGKIIKSQRIDTKNGTNTYKLALTNDMAPNVYVHLTLIQPHMQTANSLPIRLYGVIPVLVDNPETKLNPVITSAEKMEPNKTASFTVSESSGKAMTYTLAVVDEGLLGLTNFHAPDIRKEFNKKEASELQNWDIYKYVINAYSGKLETMLAIGGSEDILDNAKNNENRFAPVVRYFGPFTIKAGEKKTTEFEMPYYVGAVRAIVIAGNNGAYGKAEKTVPVKSELMSQPSIPRTIGTNEKINIPVTIFNGENKDKNVTVTFSARGITNFSKTENVSVTANSNKTVNFLVETKNPGHVLFETTATDGKYSTKSSTDMNIQSRGTPVTYQTTVAIKPGKTSSVSVETPGEKGSSKLSVELSNIIQTNFSQRLSYLISYPHGCIEQITSGGFPQLYISDFTKLTPEKTNELKANVISVLDRYPTYQTSVGAMGYWPGNSSPHAWGTCYATHFMLEAKKQGYTVPENILTPALDWLVQSAKEWQFSNNNESTATQAYRLFVIALAGKADISSMNRLYETRNLTDETLLLLSAAYSLAGRKDTAKELMNKTSSIKSDYRNTGDDFSSSIRLEAIRLFTATQLDSNSPLSSDMLAKSIAETLASDKWLNTQETAWSLFSLLPYYSKMKTSEVKYEISNDLDSKAGSFTEKALTENLPVSYKFPQQLVTIKNTGNTTLYATVSCSGLETPGKEETLNKGISLTVDNFYSLSNIKAGEEVRLKVRIRNNTRKEVKNLVLAVPVGTCLEFSNERIANEKYSSTYTYQDIRDDVIYTYFDLPNSSYSTDFIFTATAAYSGNFYVPAIHAEAMYDESIKAVTPGFLVEMLK